jgi:hypothetical protein
MTSDELVGAIPKRAALADVLSEHAADAFGEDLNVIETPLRVQLNLRSRRDRLDIMRNDAGDVRLLEVYYFGPEDADTASGTTGSGSLKVEGNRQFGQPDRFRVILHYGFGDGDTYDAFYALLQQQRPERGLYRLLAEVPAIETDGGRLVSVSTPQTPSVPPVPRPLEDTGDERAHYAEFDVIVTDQP